MLTKNQSSGLKKYLLVIPVLALSVMVMATAADKGERRREGNTTFYKGNAFEWEKESPGDTIIMEDPATGKERTVISRKDPAIIRFNKLAVIDYQNATTRPQFANDGVGFIDYLKARLTENKVKVPQNISDVSIANIVLNKNGEIVYFDLIFMDRMGSGPISPYNYDPIMSPALEKIIADSPRWVPATKNGKPCDVFMNDFNNRIKF